MPALLFDNDGTLIESELLCCQTICEIYQDEKNVSLDANTMFQRFRGWELAKILDCICEEHGATWDQAFVARYRERMFKNFETRLQAIEGIHTALAALPYPKAVVSNGPLKKMQDGLRITGLSDYFGNNLVSAYEINIFKPDPEIYLYSANLLNSPAAECFVIEDSPVGVEAGAKAGMHVFFYNTHNDPCAFANVTQFQSMYDLPGLINSRL